MNLQPQVQSLQLALATPIASFQLLLPSAAPCSLPSNKEVLAFFVVLGGVFFGIN